MELAELTPSPKRFNSASHSSSSGDDHDHGADGQPPKQRKKPGRAEKPPQAGETKRQAQMREAQRAHRERRRNYIAELEKKVAELTAGQQASAPTAAAALLSGVPAFSPTIAGMAAVDVEKEAMRQMIASLQTMNQIAEQRNYLLESKIGQLLSETSSLKGIVAAFTGNGLMFPSSQPPNQPDPNSSPFQLDPTLFPNSQSWLIDDLGLGESSSFNNVDFPLFSNKKPSSVSTGSPESFTESTKSDASTLYELLDMPESSSLNITSLYGPFDVGDSREEIKAVPSLRTFEKPDHIFDLIMAQADASCPKVVRMYSLQITGFKFKILDACTVLDKTRVIEIIETFKDKNSKRTAHLYIDVSTEREPIGPKAEAIIQPQLLPVRDAMKSIPSLSTGADDLMDELLGNFSIKCTMKEFEQPPKNDEKCDMFANYLGLHVKLRNLCKTKEERAALMLNMEIARGLNHDLVNYWLEKAIKMESE